MGLLNKLIQKWSCQHDWECLKEIKCFAHEGDKIPFKYIYLYKCKNCGKIKK